MPCIGDTGRIKLETMKTAVIYYSMGGNTAFAARRIAEKTGADLIEIRPVKAYPDKGFSKFFRGGKSAVMAEMPELEPYVFDAGEYEQVVIGFPVWAGTIAPPVRTFAVRNREALAGKKLFAFACQSGSGAEKAFGKLTECLDGAELAATLILIDPKDRPKEENTRKIEDFCKAVKR